MEEYGISYLEYGVNRDIFPSNFNWCEKEFMFKMQNDMVVMYEWESKYMKIKYMKIYVNSKKEKILFNIWKTKFNGNPMHGCYRMSKSITKGLSICYQNIFKICYQRIWMLANISYIF